MWTLKLIWTEQALSDLEEIEAFIAIDNPRAATRVAKQVYRDALVLRRNPYLGRIGQIAGTRELIIHDLPYLLVYEVHSQRVAQHVRILAVFHTARAWWLASNHPDEET